MGEETNAIDGKFTRSSLGADRAPFAAKRDRAAHARVFGELIKLHHAAKGDVGPVVWPKNGPIFRKSGGREQCQSGWNDNGSCQLLLLPRALTPSPNRSLTTL